MPRCKTICPSAAGDRSNRRRARVDAFDMRRRPRAIGFAMLALVPATAVAAGFPNSFRADARTTRRTGSRTGRSRTTATTTRSAARRARGPARWRSQRWLAAHARGESWGIMRCEKLGAPQLLAARRGPGARLAPRRPQPGRPPRRATPDPHCCWRPTAPATRMRSRGAWACRRSSGTAARGGRAPSAAMRYSRLLLEARQAAPPRGRDHRAPRPHPHRAEPDGRRAADELLAQPLARPGEPRGGRRDRASADQRRRRATAHAQLQRRLDATPGRKRRDSAATQPSTASSTGTSLRSAPPQGGEHRARGGPELAPGPEVVHHERRLARRRHPAQASERRGATPRAGRWRRLPPAATSRPAPAAPRGCRARAPPRCPGLPSIAIEKITVPSTSGAARRRWARPRGRRGGQRRDDEPRRDRPQHHPGDARHQQAERDRRAQRHGARVEAPAGCSRSDSPPRGVHVQRVSSPAAATPCSPRR